MLPDPRDAFYSSPPMYTVGVRDHLKIAHSLRGPVFGRAQRLHGATLTVEVELEREELDEAGVVLEIGFIQARLREVLDQIDHQNLDEHAGFQGRPSTAEHIARWIHRELGRRLPVPGGGVMKVTLREEGSGWGSYNAPLPSMSTPPPMA
jgi:6-pyruvoyltetrahydropterin/6-carboxytetrahydropterin synthase